MGWWICEACGYENPNRLLRKRMCSCCGKPAPGHIVLQGVEEQLFACFTKLLKKLTILTGTFLLIALILTGVQYATVYSSYEAWEAAAESNLQILSVFSVPKDVTEKGLILLSQHTLEYPSSVNFAKTVTPTIENIRNFLSGLGAEFEKYRVYTIQFAAEKGGRILWQFFSM